MAKKRIIPKPQDVLGDQKVKGRTIPSPEEVLKKKDYTDISEELSQGSVSGLDNQHGEVVKKEQSKSPPQEQSEVDPQSQETGEPEMDFFMDSIRPEVIPEQGDATQAIGHQALDHFKKEGFEAASARSKERNDQAQAERERLIARNEEQIKTNPFYKKYFTEEVNRAPEDIELHTGFIDSQEEVPTLLKNYKDLQDRAKEIGLINEGLFEGQDPIPLEDQKALAKEMFEIKEVLNDKALSLLKARKDHNDPNLGLTDEQVTRNTATDLLDLQYKKERKKLMSNYGYDKKEGVKDLNLTQADADNVESVLTDFDAYLENIATEDIDKWQRSIGKPTSELLEEYVNDVLYPRVRDGISNYDPTVLKKFLGVPVSPGIHTGMEPEMEGVGIEEGSGEVDPTRKELFKDLKTMIVLSAMVDYGYDPGDYFGWNKTGLDENLQIRWAPGDKALAGLGGGVYKGVIGLGSKITGSDVPISENMMSIDLMSKGSVVESLNESFHKIGAKMPEEMKEWSKIDASDKVQSALKTTGEILPEFMAGGVAFGGAKGLLTGLGAMNKVARLTNNLSKVAKTGSSYMSRVMSRAALKGMDIAETGLLYETTGILLDQEEGDFASGAAGKTGSDLMLYILSKVVPGKTSPVLQAFMSKVGAGLGEVAEETSQTYIQAKDWQAFKDQFKTGEDIAVFLGTTFVMGALMGTASGGVENNFQEWAMAEYKNLSLQEKKIFDDMTGRADIKEAVTDAVEGETVGESLSSSPEDELNTVQDRMKTIAKKAKVKVTAEKEVEKIKEEVKEDLSGGPMGMESSAVEEAESLTKKEEDKVKPKVDEPTAEIQEKTTAPDSKKPKSEKEQNPTKVKADDIQEAKSKKTTDETIEKTEDTETSKGDDVTKPKQEKVLEPSEELATDEATGEPDQEIKVEKKTEEKSKPSKPKKAVKPSFTFPKEVQTQVDKIRNDDFEKVNINEIKANTPKSHHADIEFEYNERSRREVSSRSVKKQRYPDTVQKEVDKIINDDPSTFDMKAAKAKVPKTFHSDLEREYAGRVMDRMKNDSERSNPRVKTQKESNWKSKKHRVKIEKVIKRMTKAVVGTEVYTDSSTVKQAWVEKGGDVNSVPAGFTYENEIYVNFDKARPDTVAHEFAHVWLQIAKNRNTALFKRGVDLAKNTDAYGDYVEGNPLSEETVEQITEEIMAESVGQRVANILDKPAHKQWVSDVFNWLKSVLGIKPTVNVQNITLPKLLELVAKDLVHGRDVGKISSLATPDSGIMNNAAFKVKVSSEQDYFYFKEMEADLAADPIANELAERTRYKGLVETAVTLAADSDAPIRGIQERIVDDHINNRVDKIKKDYKEGKLSKKERNTRIRSLKKYSNRSRIKNKLIGDEADVYAVKDLMTGTSANEYRKVLEGWFGKTSQENDYGVVVSWLTKPTDWLGGNRVDKNSIAYKLQQEGLTVMDAGFYRYMQHVEERNENGVAVAEKAILNEIKKKSSSIDGLTNDDKVELEKTLNEIESKYKKERKLEREKAKAAGTSPNFTSINEEQQNEFEDRVVPLIRETPLNDLIPTMSSGMSTTEAKERMDRMTSELSEDQIKILDESSGEMQKVFHKALDIKAESGIISNDTADLLKDHFEYYVPLKVKPKSHKNRTGSIKSGGVYSQGIHKVMPTDEYTYWQRENPVVSMFVDYNQTVVDAGKNNMLNSFATLIRKNPLSKDGSKFWEVSDTEPSPINGVEAIPFFEDGKKSYIRLTDPKLAAAFKSSFTKNEFLKGVYKVATVFSNYMKMSMTGFNVEFMLPNFQRDLGESLVNLGDQEVDKIRRNTTKGIAPSMLAIRKTSLNKEGSTEVVKEYMESLEEMIAAGGKIDFMDRIDIRNAEQLIKDYQKQIEQPGVAERVMNVGMKASMVRPALKAILMGNQMTEMGVRLSVYHNLRKQGVTAQKAAQTAKNITVNFSKKGEFGTWMNALYLFYNASVGGTMRFYRGLKSPVVRKSLYSLMAVQAANRMLLDALGDEDDDGLTQYDKLHQYEKDWNFIIYNPIGGLIKIPIPHSLAPFKSMVDDVYDVVKENKTVGDATGHTMEMFAKSFVPMWETGPKGPAQKFAASISPDILDPFLESSMNTDFFTGGKVYKEKHGGSDKFDHEIFNKNTPEFLKEAAKVMFDETGGYFDPRPDVMAHYMDSFKGGFSGLLRNGMMLNDAFAAESHATIDKTPILRRMYAQTHDLSRNESIFREKFWDIREKGKNNKLSEKEVEEFKKAALFLLKKSEDKSIRPYYLRQYKEGLTQQAKKYRKSK